MIAMGIDPGLANPATAVIQLRQQGCAVLHVEHTKTNKDRSDSLRLTAIAIAISRIRRAYKPELIAVEEQARAIVGATNRGQTNAKSLQNLVVVGMTCSEAVQCRARWLQVTIDELKNCICGKGNRSSGKAMVRRAIKDTPQRFDLSRLPKTFRWNEHKTDAVAVAYTAALIDRMRRLTRRTA